MSERRLFSCVVCPCFSHREKRKSSGMAWLPEDGRIWESAVWAERTEKHRRSCLTVSWDIKLILNNHHTVSYASDLLHSQTRMMLSEGLRIGYRSALRKVWLSWLCTQTMDHRTISRTQKQFSFVWEFEHTVTAKQWEFGSQKRQDFVNWCKRSRKTALWGNTAVKPQVIR